MKFRKKPVVIEAMQWDGSDESTDKIVDFMNGRGILCQPSHLEIQTLEGSHIASIGDWIIKGVKGEFYPCKPDIFEATYEPA
jgi:hypothetical protein